MTSWLDRNKGFVYTILVAAILVGVSWGTIQGRIASVAAQAEKTEAALQKECERSKGVDRDRQEQVARIEEKLRTLEVRSKEVKRAVDKTNDKLDWLIRNQMGGNGDN